MIATPRTRGCTHFNPCEAFELIEVIIAAAIVAVFLGGMFEAGLRPLALLKSAKESATATQAMEEVIEQMRIVSWPEITSATYLRDNLLSTAITSTAGLGGVTEQVTVSAYPPRANPPTPIQVTKQGGSVTINSDNPNLVSEKMVRVDLTLSWQATLGTRNRARQTFAVIAQGGIRK